MTGVAGRQALVTGGQRGLGAALTAELLARGAERVYVTARDPRPSEDSRVVALPLEVTDPAAVESLTARIQRVSIVVNNAGATMPYSLLDTSMDDIVALFETNVFGALRVARAAAPILASNGGGTLVDIHSVLSWLSGTGAYGATKAALWSVTNSLRVELAGQGTTVIGVHLGLADTDMTARFVGPAKLSPGVVASAVADAIENDQTEVLVDDASRAAKAILAGPVEDLVVRI